MKIVKRVRLQVDVLVKDEEKLRAAFAIAIRRGEFDYSLTDQEIAEMDLGRIVTHLLIFSQFADKIEGIDGIDYDDWGIQIDDNKAWDPNPQHECGFFTRPPLNILPWSFPPAGQEEFSK